MITLLRVFCLTFALGFSLGTVGCGTTCNPPDKITYDCTPVPATSDGCTGGPRNKDGTTPDSDKKFPVGCNVKRPFCLDAYPDTVAFCACRAIAPGTPPDWVCPV